MQLTKLQEDIGTYPQISTPEEFMQTRTPQSLVKSGTSQTIYNVGLQPGEEMDFSEFSDFDHEYARMSLKIYCAERITDNLFIATSTRCRP